MSWPSESLTRLNSLRSAYASATDAGGAGLDHGADQGILERRAVGQPGQGVVVREIGDLPARVCCRP
jgi:hypothetical protein